MVHINQTYIIVYSGLQSGIWAGLYLIFVCVHVHLFYKFHATHQTEHTFTVAYKVGPVLEIEIDLCTSIRD